jgi:anionic cell wall polymer biosynthesis LytR-Cps2A-Psr (LCP) family protein
VVDEVEGIDLVIDHAFTDSLYPRDDVAPDILPVADRYRTVSFASGQNHLDGTRALEYIRSRQGQNPQENTDDSRAVRQQKVLVALFAKLTTRSSLQNPAIYGRLYRLWHEQVKTSLTDQYIISLARFFYENRPAIVSLNIPVQTATTSGLIFHPPLTKYRQWVYEPVDSSWTEFGEYFRQNLDL